MITKKRITVRKALPRTHSRSVGRVGSAAVAEVGGWVWCRRRLTGRAIAFAREAWKAYAMRRPLIRLLAGTCVSVLGVGVLVAPSQGAPGTDRSVSAGKAAYKQPSRGPGNSRIPSRTPGVLKVKAGKRGKSPR